MFDRDQTPIAWRETGTGDALVFLHAMAGSRTAWEPQLKSLSARFRCIAWDMPGFGASVALAADAGVDCVADGLALFTTKALGRERAHYVGLSVGAMILMRFATRHPDLVSTLTLMDTSPKFGFGGTMRPAEFADPILKSLRDGVSIQAFASGMVKAIVGPKCPPPVIEEATRSMARAQRSGLMLTTRLIADHDALADLPRIAAPVLAMTGADDGETPPAYAEAIAKAVPNGELFVVPDAGHLANLENPAAVNARLAAFLEKHS